MVRFCDFTSIDGTKLTVEVNVRYMDLLVGEWYQNPEEEGRPPLPPPPESAQDPLGIFFSNLFQQ